MTTLRYRKAELIVVSRSVAARRLFTLLLEREGFSSAGAEDGDEAFSLLDETGASALLVDLRSPTEEDLLFLSLLRRRRPDLGTIVLHPNLALVRCGAVERELRYGGAGGDLSPAFPALADLKSALGLILAEDQLSRLKTPVASA